MKKKKKQTNKFQEHIFIGGMYLFCFVEKKYTTFEKFTRLENKIHD